MTRMPEESAVRLLRLRLQVLPPLGSTSQLRGVLLASLLPQNVLTWHLNVRMPSVVCLRRRPDFALGASRRGDIQHGPSVESPIRASAFCRLDAFPDSELAILTVRTVKTDDRQSAVLAPRLKHRRRDARKALFDRLPYRRVVRTGRHATTQVLVWAQSVTTHGRVPALGRCVAEARPATGAGGDVAGACRSASPPCRGIRSSGLQRKASRPASCRQSHHRNGCANWERHPVVQETGRPHRRGKTEWPDGDLHHGLPRRPQPRHCGSDRPSTTHGAEPTPTPHPRF